MFLKIRANQLKEGDAVQGVAGQPQPIVTSVKRQKDSPQKRVEVHFEDGHVESLPWDRRVYVERKDETQKSSIQRQPTIKEEIPDYAGIGPISRPRSVWYQNKDDTAITPAASKQKPARGQREQKKEKASFESVQVMITEANLGFQQELAHLAEAHRKKLGSIYKLTGWNEAEFYRALSSKLKTIRLY